MRQVVTFLTVIWYLVGFARSPSLETVLWYGYASHRISKWVMVMTIHCRAECDRLRHQRINICKGKVLSSLSSYLGTLGIHVSTAYKSYLGNVSVRRCFKRHTTKANCPRHEVLYCCYINLYMVAISFTAYISPCWKRRVSRIKDTADHPSTHDEDLETVNEHVRSLAYHDCLHYLSRP